MVTLTDPASLAATELGGTIESFAGGPETTIPELLPLMDVALVLVAVIVCDPIALRVNWKACWPLSPGVNEYGVGLIAVASLEVSETPSANPCAVAPCESTAFTTTLNGCPALMAVGTLMLKELPLPIGPLAAVGAGVPLGLGVGLGVELALTVADAEPLGAKVADGEADVLGKGVAGAPLEADGDPDAITKLAGIWRNEKTKYVTPATTIVSTNRSGLRSPVIRLAIGAASSAPAAKVIGRNC